MDELREWLTLKEVEGLYGVKASTLRAYIYRGEVMPKDCISKVGKQWVIKRSWAAKKYGGAKNVAKKRF